MKRVQNFTDVDDKIIQRANTEGCDPFELADRNIEAYLEVMDTLNVRRADAYPRATEHIPEMIDMINALISKGFAYEAGGSVYFRVTSYPEYGNLSGRSLEHIRNNEDLDNNTETANGVVKENPADFALWKAARPEEPCWESPWGPGRPGWHIECSAMARCYFGDTIDVHAGGIDLIFPHHENEIAQSEAFSGRKPFARFWMHNGLLEMPGGDKMSKSLGNISYVDELLKHYSADAVRLWILQSHYRSPLLMDEAAIDDSEKAIQRLRAALDRDSGTGEKPEIARFRSAFIQSMDDDLGTPRAVSVLFSLRRTIQNVADSGGDVSDCQALFRELSTILGFSLEAVPDVYNPGSESPNEDLIERIVRMRNEARSDRRFADADALRDKLVGMGVELRDTAQGTEWTLKRRTC